MTNKESEITLVAALGNHGNQYETTRHNIAWQMLYHLPFYDDLDWKSKFNGEYASYQIDGRKIFFLKPMTYMNLSGRSLQPMMQFFKIEIPEILVVHDDLEMGFGVYGFKNGGGLGGHNGLRSVTDTLATRDYKRMRLGISRPVHGDITPYVLGNFSGDEQAVLPTYLEQAAEALETCLGNDFNSMVKKHRKTDVFAGTTPTTR